MFKKLCYLLQPHLYACLVGLMCFHPLLPQCCESRFLQHIIQAVGKTGTSLKLGENIFWSLCESRYMVVAKIDSGTFKFLHLAGSWWCECSNGAGLWDSGAGELPTDSGDGGDHLWALHVPKSSQRLSGVSTSQVSWALMIVYVLWKCLIHVWMLFHVFIFI